MAESVLTPFEIQAPIAVKRWSSERPLRILVALAAICLWVALAFSLIGIAYAAMIGAFFFFAHVGFITHLRGNGVRLGPEQMPDLYRRVNELAAKLGMRRSPDAYVLQAGGVLNALATRFLGSSFIVLYSDLLDACGDDDGARDFIIAHELGHLAAGHLRWRWLLLPGLATPFLGTAYSRACEYTSDRYGMAVSRDSASAQNGLCILAAGGRHGPQVNRRALVDQRRDLATGWMKLGQWLGTHPPIAKRLAVLEPALATPVREGRATASGLAIVAALVLVPTAIVFGAIDRIWPKIQQAIQQAEQQRRARAMLPESGAAAPPPAAADAALREQVRVEILALASVATEMRTRSGAPPADAESLYAAFRAANPETPSPLDSYHGTPYGYQVDGTEFVIWSPGPDPDDRSDDLYYSSAAQAQ
jgi:Zn-dependent protease with chaperone function